MTNIRDLCDPSYHDFGVRCIFCQEVYFLDKNKKPLIRSAYSIKEWEKMHPKKGTCPKCK
jgi:hypothetical protein